MPIRSLLLILLACAIWADVLARETPGLLTRKSVSQVLPHAPEKHPGGTFVQANSSGNSGHRFLFRRLRTANPVLVRPNAGKGVDKIRFGLIAKNFFGAVLKKNRFNIDMVLSVRWNDPRVISLIPYGLENVTLAWSQALDLVWMPGLVVANKDIEMYEIISSSVTIYRSGDVMRVERAQARVMNKYKLAEYPFDEQGIALEVVSSKYMLDEVVLVPNMNVSRVEEDIWGLYRLKSWEVEAYDDYNGDLQKSRGKLVMHLGRYIDKYVDDHLVPTFIVLTISWAVFYFPFGKDRNPFITPRLALSILCLLTFTNLMVKSSKELPGSAPFNWNDLFNQQVQCLLFLTIVLNICSEIFLHHFDEVSIAKMINNEAKFMMPFLSLLNCGVILTSGRFHLMSLYVATILTKTLIFSIILFYAGYIFFTWKGNTKAGGEELIVAASQEEGENDGDPDCDCDAGA